MWEKKSDREYISKKNGLVRTGRLLINNFLNDEE